jgi:hypothetical protein
MLKFCVSLTTIPSRLKFIHKTLNSIRNQNKLPDKIFLNIPYKYQRFKKEKIETEFLKKIKFIDLEIIRCDDYGPGTKLLGAIKYIKEFDYVILIDDDHVYKKEMLEIFYKQSMLNIENSYSFCVQNIKDCKVGQGADGFMINKKYLDKILIFYKKYVKNNNKLFYNDDLWISIYLNKIRKVKIKNLNIFLKKNFFNKNPSVYKKHTAINALIEVYNENRKLARKLRYEENCREYLLLKKKTNNFKNF